MNIDWIEWFGYLASLIVLVSLTMSSIIKLRLINLFGCTSFALFAFLINSYPTMFMNLGITAINIYYLWKYFKEEEKFKLISVAAKGEYFNYFLSTNRSEIELHAPIEELRTAHTAFFMLRNNMVAGVLVGNIDNQGVFSILLDYATPEYRDFKLASHFYETNPEFIKERGISSLVATPTIESHRKYLIRVGFKLIDGEDNTYCKVL